MVSLQWPNIGKPEVAAGDSLTVPAAVPSLEGSQDGGSLHSLFRHGLLIAFYMEWMFGGKEFCLPLEEDQTLQDVTIMEMLFHCSLSQKTSKAVSISIGKLQN